VVLKLLDDVPLLWRTPSSAQLGVDAPVVVLPDVGPGAERLLTALRSGISHSGWAMLCREAKIETDEARTLLERLGPLLVDETDPAPRRAALVTGSGPIASTLADLLRDAGLLAAPSTADPDLAVLVADWVIGPGDAAHWLRRDVPHLPIVASDRQVTIGPVVEPGCGPCVYCLQLARRDADPAWPALASQLWGRDPAPRSMLAAQGAAVFAARRIAERLADGPQRIGRGWRIADDTGTVSAWSAAIHPECSCAAPPESDWAPGPALAAPAAPTTG
jgi:bacteriocin biosynthesis cyclodehydratase domain-containing protein